jgi:antitoxin (DNA-binding transcriptional repressor) of toxin-antitoxin stability system
MAGETLDIVRRGKLAARIVPVGDSRVAPIPARYATPDAEPAGGWLGVDELRTRAGRWLDRVAAGETINVVRAGRLLAQIVPAGGCSAAPLLTQEEIGLGEFRARAGRYVDRVMAGETLRVIRRGRVVQILSPGADPPRTA